MDPYKQKKSNTQIPSITIQEAIEVLLSSPNHCSKRWVWEQYDHMILNNTLKRPGLDAAVTRIEKRIMGWYFPVIATLIMFDKILSRVENKL